MSVVLAAAALVLAGFLLELRTGPAPAVRRAIRVVALAAAATALAVIGLRPERTIPTARSVVVATPGAEPGAARRLARELDRPLVVFGDSSLARGLGVPFAPDGGALARIAPAETLHVVGWGLGPAEWRAAPPASVVPHPAALPPGVRHVSWPRRPPLGRPVEVQGAAQPGAFLRLEEAGRVLDSARADSLGRFTLRALPRAAGPAGWVLAGGAGGDRRDTLGLDVALPAPLRVLVLEGSPSFETRALRDWLARRGAAVAIRSTISRNRTRTELVNLPRRSLDRMDDSTLAAFDVVIADGRSLAALGAASRDALARAVRRRLGLLVRADTAVFGGAVARLESGAFLAAPLRPVAGAAEREIRVAWGGSPSPTAVAAAGYELVPGFASTAVATDGVGRVVAAVTPRGSGRVGLSLVQSPSRWIRAGHEAAFAGYWSALLDAVAPAAPAPVWRVEREGPIFAGRPVPLEARNAGPAGIVTAPDGARDSILLVRDPAEPGRQVGTWWPRRPGWHRLPDGAGVLVNAAGAWPAWQAAERLAATRLAALNTGGGRPLPPRRAPAGLAGWFLLFVGATGVLWATGRRAPD